MNWGDENGYLHPSTIKPTRNIKQKGVSSLILATLLLSARLTQAQLPSDFPELSDLPNNGPAPGDIVGSINSGGVAGVSNYFAVLDNNLNPVVLSLTNSLGTLQQNGLFAASEGAPPPPVGTNAAPKSTNTVSYILQDENFNTYATYVAGNGYNADTHDFEVLPNGHVLIESYDNNPVVDLSGVVPNGFPAAAPTQSIIQELDVTGKVIWQWRSLDHIPITDSYQTLTAPSLGDYIHLNSLTLDNRDGTLIVSLRNTSEVIKINRTTGQTVWYLGGKHNQFTFSNAIPGNTDPAFFVAQHNARRLPNGDITIWDNGSSQHSDPSYNFTRPYTRAVEYALDETNFTANLIWEFRHNPDIITLNGGSVTRLPGGHSILQWGGNNSTDPGLLLTEADQDGNLVTDINALQSGVTGTLARVQWPIETNYINNTQRELTSPDTYDFTDGSSNNTGVSLDLDSLNGQQYSGDNYNSVTVSSQPYAPVLPYFTGRAPRVLPIRVQISGTEIYSISADLSFDANVFGLTSPDNLAITSPSNLTVYYRATPGQGEFTPLPTYYDPVAQQLETSLSGFGEYIFGFPDVPEVAYPPLLVTPASGQGVNQTLPVPFFWTPVGFASSYHLQVSTDPTFGSTVVDASGLTNSLYTLSNIQANATYYWRVNTTNDAGLSDWSTNSFTTVPPLLQLTVPSTNGGEVWERGYAVNLRWNDNVTENVALDLYKSGSFVENIVTNSPTVNAYQWKIPRSLAVGNGYSITIRSTKNPALTSSSGEFSLGNVPPISIQPIPLNSATNGQPQQFAFTAPGATSAIVWGTAYLTNNNFNNWVNLGQVTVTNGSGVFAVTAPYKFYQVTIP